MLIKLYFLDTVSMFDILSFDTWSYVQQKYVVVRQSTKWIRLKQSVLLEVLRVLAIQLEDLLSL